MTFYMVSADSGRNGFNKERIEDWLKDNPSYTITEEKEIKVRTLDDIISQVGYMPDYMSIDVEGMEYDILNAYNLKDNGPKIMTIEIMTDNNEYNNKLISLIKESGYFMWLVIDENLTFVKDSFKDAIYSKLTSAHYSEG